MSNKHTEIKKQVRDRYARAAKTSSWSCCPVIGPGSDGQPDSGQEKASRLAGYSSEELAAIPGDANLGLGCGNPTAVAGLKTGEVVLDLGAGAGIDCFLAAQKVGPDGRVIGVDMTPEMIDRARGNARENDTSNVEFRLGEIENLPVADGSVDVIISNCVINLSTDKPRVFREAFRVLRPGGRIMISDLVLRKPLPRVIQDSVEAYVSCIAGAMIKGDYLNTIREAGFKDVVVVSEKTFPVELVLEDSLAPEVLQKLKIPRQELEEHVTSVISVNVTATKPMI